MVLIRAENGTIYNLERFDEISLEEGEEGYVVVAKVFFGPPEGAAEDEEDDDFESEYNGNGDLDEWGEEEVMGVNLTGPKTQEDATRVMDAIIGNKGGNIDLTRPPGGWAGL